MAVRHDFLASGKLPDPCSVDPWGLALSLAPVFYIIETNDLEKTLGLVTRRSQVEILPPLPLLQKRDRSSQNCAALAVSSSRSATISP